MSSSEATDSSRKITAKADAAQAENAAVDANETALGKVDKTPIASRRGAEVDPAPATMTGVTNNNGSESTENASAAARDASAGEAGADERGKKRAAADTSSATSSSQQIAKRPRNRSRRRRSSAAPPVFQGRRDLDRTRQLTTIVLWALQKCGKLDLLNLSRIVRASPDEVAEILDVLLATPLVSICKSKPVGGDRLRYQYAGGAALPQPVDLAILKHTFSQFMGRVTNCERRISCVRKLLDLPESECAPELVNKRLSDTLEASDSASAQRVYRDLLKKLHAAAPSAASTESTTKMAVDVEESSQMKSTGKSGSK